MLSLGALIGCVFAGKVLDFLGRRMTLMLVSPMLALGWSIVALSMHLHLVYVGRFICGFATGFLLPGVQVCIINF